MNPWLAAGLFAGVVYLVGRRARRSRGDSPGGAGEAGRVLLEGADSLWLEAHDAFGAPISTISGNQADYAGVPNGPAIPFGN